MKKQVLLMLVCLTLSLSCVAQGEIAEKMARQMTEQMTKQYGLTKKQIKKVRALNEDFATKVLAMTHRLGRRDSLGAEVEHNGIVVRDNQRRPAWHSRRGQGQKPDSLWVKRFAPHKRDVAHAEGHRRLSKADSAAIAQQRALKRAERRKRMAAHEAEARRIRDEYDSTLSVILTEQQMSLYRSSLKK